jgi:hypothetical protein
MPHLVLLCNIERVPVLDTAANESTTAMLGFSLNIGAAWSDGSAPNMAHLRPWLWGEITKVRFERRDGNNSVLDTDTVVVIPQTGRVAASALAPLTKRLEDIQQSARFEWSVTRLQEGASEVTAETRYWHAVLGQISVLPFPVPQSLNLSFLFRVPVRSGATQIVAAPVLPGTPERAPGAFEQNAVEKRVWTSTYGGSDPDAVAYVAPCPVEAPPDAFVNLSTLWIEPPAQVAHDADWLGRVEETLTDAFIISPLITEFLRQRMMATPPDSLLSRDGNLRTCVDLALVALRDVVGLGLEPELDGSRLVDRLFRGLSSAMSTAQSELLLDRSRVLFATVTAWRRLLREALATEGPLRILEDAWVEQPVSDVLNQLEELYGLTLYGRRNETLQAIWRLQWRTVLADEEVVKTVPENLRAQMQAAVNEAPASINLRRALAREHLGRFWRALINSNTDPNDRTGQRLLAHCAPAYIRYYARLRWRLGTIARTDGQCRLPATDPRVVPTLSDTVVLADELREALIAQVAAYAGDLAVQLDPPTQARQDQTPHAVTWQLARLQSVDTDDESNQFSDVMRRISGVGVLMRQLSSGGTLPWRCLNMAHLYADGQAIALDGNPLLVPYRMPYRAGLRQVTISYNNQSIIADSPLAQPEMSRVVLHGDDLVDAKELVKYHYSTGEGGRVPGLVYGHVYQWAAFAIGNAGVLPSALASAESPCRLQLSAQLTTPAVRQLTYQRRVPIGGVRLSESGDLSKPARFPALPKEVSPRARDLPAVASLPEAPLLLMAPSGWNMPGNRQPDRFDCQVAPPQVAWECWDRWQAGAGVTTITRRAVLADYYRSASTDRNANVKLDDPAVASMLYFEMAKETAGTFQTVPARGVLLAPLPTSPVAADSVRKFQSPGVRLRCRLRDSEPEGLRLEQTPDGPTVVVSVRRGQVYKLRVCACLRSGLPAVQADRFAAGVATAVATHEGVGLVSPTDLLIETATELLPEETAVWQACATSFNHAPDRGRWYVSATLNGTSDPFAMLHRVEISRQVWRWLGRPTALHPEIRKDWNASEETSLMDETRRWEAVEFGSRTDSDCAILDMPRLRPVETGSTSAPSVLRGIRSFRYEETLADRDGTHEERGLHYRFSLRAFSRYEGIMPAAVRPFVTAQEDVSTRTPGSVVTPTNVPVIASLKNRWRSQFVPCRRESIPAPKVRFILPLTEPSNTRRLLSESRVGGAEETDQSPGLLVVMHETWHQIGGLGEELQAEVDIVRDPTASQPAFFAEAGPDPIQFGNPSLRLERLPSNSAGLSFGRPIGPVGHYFDRDSNSALFVHTSFIVPAPRLPAKKPTDLSWWFAKVRFRRTQRTRRPQALTAASRYRPENAWKLVELTSEPSDPFWVQYLPPFSIFDGEVSLDGVRARQISGRRFVLLSDANGPVALTPAPSDHNVFQLYGVLTRIVTDITGRSDQEQYLSLLEPIGTEWQSPTAIDVGRDQHFRIRIIEVQRPKWRPAGAAAACAAPKDLWEELFGPPGEGNRNCDATARIVRISEPIDSWAAEACRDTQ